MNTAKTKRLAAFIISLVMMLSLIPTQALATPTNERYGASAIAALENGENFTWAYNTLKAGVEASQERISFVDANHSLNVNDFQAILDVYCNDNPQHFWLGKGATSFFAGNNLTAVELTYTFTGDELTTAKPKFDAAAADALSGITDDMSQFEIELYLHDYLVSHVTYDLTASHVHDAYGALVEGRAVCEGYARAFQYLLQQAGIPSYVVTGKSKGEDHAWNLVKIDGAYYYVDVTWDDQDNDNKYYSYFNVTTETLCEDHTIAQQIYTLPNCTATAANYFTVKGGKIENGDIDTLSRLLDAGNLFARVYVTGDADAFEKWIRTNIWTIADEMGVTNVTSCSRSRLGREFLLQVDGDYTHVHDLTHVDAVASTCHEEGNVEYWSCSKCGKLYADAAATRQLTSVSTAIDPNNHDGNTELRNASVATCEKTGYTGDTYCLGCNAKLTTGTIIPKAHSMTHVDAVPGTCKDNGTKEHWHCSKCNKDFAEKTGDTVLTDLSTPKDPTNHAGGTEVRNASEATCVKPGYTGDTYCLGCNAKLTSGTETHKDHSTTYVAAVPATCKDTGTKEHWHCASCNKNFADKDGATVLTDLTTAKDPANHAGGTEVRNASEATCANPGYTGDTYCLGCNTKLATGTVIPAGHKLNRVEGVAATCKATGTAEHWHCTVCNENFSDANGENPLSDLILPIDPNNHVGGTRKENANDPGCDHPGYTGDIYCVSCDVKLADGQEVPAGHTTTQVNEIPATCKDTGTAAHWHCSRCDKNFEDAAGTQELTDLTIAKKPVNHAGGTELRNSADPSCKADGYTGDTYCLGCNEQIGTGTTIPTSHVLTAVPAKAATCTTIGTKGYWQCSCGKVYANDANRTPLNSADDCALPIDPTNHVGFKEAWETNADSHWHACTGCAEGKSELIAHVFDNSCDTTCNVCGYTRTITHTPAADYSYDTNGHWKVCSVCSKTIEAIEAHKGGTATCKDKAVCSVCGQPYGSLGTHTVANWTQVSAPTFTKAGEKKGTCSVCDTKILDSIPMLTMPTDNKDNGSTKLEKSDLTTVPSALSNIESLNTLDKIKEILRKSISQQSSAVSESNTKYYDVVLYVKDANGNLIPMSAENLPDNGEVTILLAYPEGTNKDNFVFFASHVITDARYGEVGTVETPAVTATDNGLEIKLHGTSPVALGWYQKVSSSRPQGPTVITTAGSQRTSAATGDISILAYALAASSSLGLGAVMITTKRRR